MRIVAALGGNALLRRAEPMTAENQRQNVARAAKALAPLILGSHELIITHGNGPQIGLIALQAAAGPADGAHPLDILDAESEGMIGYLIEQELDNQLPSDRLLATLLTQIRVDPDDPAFSQPTKPIGPVYDKLVAERLAAERGWTIAKDGEHWRRVVASPRPLEILEVRVIELLVRQGVTVICAGGGGIPVVEGSDGSLRGVEAVIDKDHASALLARSLGADLLLLLTDIDAVYANWRGPEQRAIRLAGSDVLDPEDFAAGSMRPKIDAAIGFAGETGRRTVIGALGDAIAMVAGTAGTTIVPGAERMVFYRD